jgi:hypothetical protein
MKLSFSLATCAAALTLLAIPANTDAYGAAHFGYTHVGPAGVYHTGRTYASGPGGVYAGGRTGAYGYGGAAYSGGFHYGATTYPSYGGVHYGATYNSGYRYTPSYYGGASYGGYRYIR